MCAPMSLLNNDCLPENLRDLSSGWEHHLLSRVFYSDFNCSLKKKMFMWPFKIIIIIINYQESISNSLSFNKTQYLSVSSYLVRSIIIKLMTEPSEEMSLSAPLEWKLLKDGEHVCSTLLVPGLLENICSPWTEAHQDSWATITSL